MTRNIIIFLLVMGMPLYKAVGIDAYMLRRSDPVHPRSAAMAQATTALSGASEAMFDNPAGMAMMDHAFDVALARRSWISDMLFYQGSIALRPAGGRFGTLGLTSWREDFGVEECVVADNDSGYTIEMIPLYHQSIGLGYALSPVPSLSLGGHVRYMEEFNDPDFLSKISTVGYDNDLIYYDLGLIYRTGLPSVRMGLTCRSYWRNDEEQEWAYVVEVGGAMDLFEVPLNLRGHSLVVALDRVYTRGLDKKMEIGAEYAFMETIFIRAGVRGPEDLPERNYGVGLQVSLGGVNFRLDYARGDIEYFGEINRFAVQVSY